MTTCIKAEQIILCCCKPSISKLFKSKDELQVALYGRVWNFKRNHSDASFYRNIPNPTRKTLLKLCLFFIQR